MRPLRARLAKVEASRRGPAAFFVALPHDAWAHGDDHQKRATEDALREHELRTGYRGPVLLGTQECLSADEWLSRYGPSAQPHTGPQEGACNRSPVPTEGYRD
jgi:hypothetical protein